MICNDHWCCFGKNKSVRALFRDLRYNAVLCFSKSSNDVISVPISSWEFIQDQLQLQYFNQEKENKKNCKSISRKGIF